MTDMCTEQTVVIVYKLPIIIILIIFKSGGGV